MIESNGLLLSYRELVKNLIKKGVTQFQVSFQTTDKIEYDKITGIKGSYDLVIKSIENVKDAGKSLHINTVIQKFNYKQLPDIVKTLISKN